MPRGRGGARQGTPGTAYPNRSDLQATEPVEVAPAKEYGERQQQQAAQRALPIAPSPTAQPPASPPAPQAPPQPPQAGMAPGAVHMLGNDLPWLHPSERPNEPVTAGLPTGAGPGPEALTGVGAMAANQAAEQGSLKTLLASLASAPASSTAIRDLAAVSGAV